ncbi:hypothetical protein ACH9DO_10115 [Kocuria sp. M1N1S27]|uniref:hypothetical protein n=1 Tax=Kocuria kalidii TaxID=3376283 RepID=UPI00379E0476
MKFNVQRVLTPAYLTSVALIVIGVLLGLAWYPVAAWLFVLSGLALNAMAVSVTAINDAPRHPGTAGRRGPFRSSRPVREDDLDDDLEDDLDGDPDGDRTRVLDDRSEGGLTTAPPAPSGGPERRARVEPDTETDATPTVPHSGSSARREPR